jgi:hypothetical protein
VSGRTRARPANSCPASLTPPRSVVRHARGHYRRRPPSGSPPEIVRTLTLGGWPPQASHRRTRGFGNSEIARSRRHSRHTRVVLVDAAVGFFGVLPGGGFVALTSAAALASEIARPCLVMTRRAFAGCALPDRPGGAGGIMTPGVGGLARAACARERAFRAARYRRHTSGRSTPMLALRRLGLTEVPMAATSVSKAASSAPTSAASRLGSDHLSLAAQLRTCRIARSLLAGSRSAIRNAAGSSGMCTPRLR